jgi:hypothetical protein
MQGVGTLDLMFQFIALQRRILPQILHSPKLPFLGHALFLLNLRAPRDGGCEWVNLRHI